MRASRPASNALPRSVAAAVALALVVLPCQGAVTTWTGSGQNWNTANWSPSAPVAGDSVVIAGDIVLTNRTVWLSSATISNAIFLFSDTTNLDAELLATNVFIRDGATVTHDLNSDTTGTPGVYGDWAMDNRVHISCVAFALDGGAVIDVTGKGYQGGAPGHDGYGPGAASTPTYHRGGAGHGGAGGAGNVETGGVTYGATNAPTDPGSGGGGASGAGGHGGGAVSIEASGVATIDGRILANATAASGNYAGGGAGGSVFVHCGAYDGSGSIEANGTDARNYGGGGAGGRIAVVHTNNTLQSTKSPAVQFSAEPGDVGGAYGNAGEFGTLYFPNDSAFPYETIRGGWVPVIPGWTEWVSPSLTITGGVIALPESFNVSISGDLTLTNGGVLRVHSGVTNGGTEYGAYVNVTGTLAVGSGSCLYPHAEPTNGGVVRIAAENVLIHAGGKIDANGLGYRESRGEHTGPSGYDGYGPGAGKQYYGGAGHGGVGGANPSWPANAGATYGSETAPVQAGSSGGGHSAANEGGAGGGAVIIYTARTGELRVNGTISADGDSGHGSYGSGGAGGTVYVDCGTLAGSGLIRANGGNAGSAAQPSGGGGGRIAIWRVLDNWAGTAFNTNVVVKGGTVTGGGGLPGTNGTLYLGQNPEPYGPPSITNMAATNVLTTSATLRGDVITTGQTTIAVSVFWGETDGGAGYGTWDHTNVFPGSPGQGLIETNVTLTQDTVYYYRFYATNAADHVWAASVATFNTGELWVEATDPNASEDGPTPGTVTVHRAAWATNIALTVHYGMSGSASNGLDYSALSGQVGMAEGASNAVIVISPLPDAETAESGEKAVVQLVPDALRTYAIRPLNTATVTIENAAIDPTNTWSGTGNWTNTSHWSANHVPVAGQHVIVTGHVTVALSTPVLGSYTLGAGHTNTFAGSNAVIRATNITVNGILTHSAVTVTNADGLGNWVPDRRVHLWAVDALTLSTSAVINVDSKGYKASYGENTGISGYDGYGPGAGLQYYGGGGHGGRGGGEAVGGGTNGSASVPSQAGSSGGGHSAGQEAGAGGGIVFLEAGGLVTLDGTISADGGNGRGSFGSGGAGGSVYIKCATFDGQGAITANGGYKGTTYGGGGGGGRIAIVYTNAAAQALLTPQFTKQVLGRDGLSSLAVPHNAEFGTLYFPGGDILPRESMTGGFNLVIPGLSSWSPGSVTVTQGEVIFANALDLHVTNDVLVDNEGGLGLGGGGFLHCDNLLIDSNSVIRLGQGAALICRDNLVVTNGGALYVTAGPTNGATEEYGQLLVVSNLMVVADSSSVFPLSDPVNGGSPIFRVRDLTVAAGGEINALGTGFGGGLNGVLGSRAPLGNGSGLGNGFGYGAGLYYRGGGGYGGQGGEGNVANRYGITYGVSNAPIHPGSGGGYGGTGSGGAGGGLVRIEAGRRIRVDGTIAADGEQGFLAYGGSGSGGGIYLYCIYFSGSGELRANGADTVDGTYGGGGGGGRIAVWRFHDQWAGTAIDSNSVSPGANASTSVATPDYGTVFLGDVPIPSGTLLIVR